MKRSTLLMAILYICCVLAIRAFTRWWEGYTPPTPAPPRTFPCYVYISDGKGNYNLSYAETNLMFGYHVRLPDGAVEYCSEEGEANDQHN